MLRFLPFSLSVIVVLLACGKTASFSGKTSPKNQSDAEGQASQIFTFDPNEKSTMADILFVVDNSSSMGVLIDEAGRECVKDKNGNLFIRNSNPKVTCGLNKTYTDWVRDGIANIDQKLFPADTRIAVMTSLTADYTDPQLAKLHPWINKSVKHDTGPRIYQVNYSNLAKEPGFLSFVNRKAVNEFMSAVAGIQASKFDVKGLNLSPVPLSEFEFDTRDAYNLEVCEQAWFAPGDKALAGHSCLVAALQNPHFGVGCEAGWHAFDQLLLKNKETSLFRANSIAHIIFISDEIHPGCNLLTAPIKPPLGADNDFQERCPTYESLRAEAMNNSALTSFKVHGIINTNEEHTKCKMTERINASKGQLIDIKKTKDYKSIFEEILKSSNPEKAIFVLNPNATGVESVFVGDKAITNWTFDAKKKVLQLNDTLNGRTDVKVNYKFKN